ncbi:hypothetical protein [Massilia rhizosphaerae]|uniref:hypothetical protein n=1 Tax=Massilia rhizosphaerae TaxID=2784389 RepID=UPI0018DD0169|nr:hypothetical protein [Massilia rhizosphaerae]
MDKRHDELLTSRLEEIITKGCTYISWNELYLWYGVRKLAARSYRDLSTRWDELATSFDLTNLGKLVFVQSPWSNNSGGIYLFAKEMAQAVNDYDG